MTKTDCRISRAVIGVVLMLVFVLITAVFSMIPSASAMLSHHGKPKNAVVQGDINFLVVPLQANSVKANPANPKNPPAPANPKNPPAPANPKNPPAPTSSTNQTSLLVINLDLKNIPPGHHRADIHQGTCLLNFSLNGKTPLDGPFTPGVTLPLGNVEAKADGTLNKTLIFPVGGNTGIPATLLQGGWFFCIHTGTLSQLQGSTPDELAASLGTFLKTKEGPGQVKQIACQALNAGAGQNSLTVQIHGAQEAGPSAKSPASTPANTASKPN